MKISIKNYLNQAQKLIDSGQYTDGCSTPFKTYIHRWLKKSKLLCAAHDFGGLNLIDGVNPGIHNNWMTWLAHMSNANPIYWLWGSVVSLTTLPWVFWRRNLGIEFVPLIPFHLFWLMAGGVVYLINITGG